MPLDINRLTGMTNDKQVKRQDNKLSTTSQAQQQNQPAASQVKADSVSLTDQAQRLTQMQQQLVNQPAVNQDRVNSIRKAIEQGEYKVDPEQLAKKLLEFEDDLSDIFKPEL